MAQNYAVDDYMVAEKFPKIRMWESFLILPLRLDELPRKHPAKRVFCQHTAVCLGAGHRTGGAPPIRHVISGCTHHHHHGQAEHHHHDCKKWDGSHAQDQWRSHEHVCTLCEWDFSPLSAPTKTTWDKQVVHHAVQPILGWTRAGFVTTTWQADWSRRGPPESA